MSRRGRQSRVPLEERLRVVLGLLSGELSVSEAARRHGVTNQTVANWRNRFLEAGKAGLENTLPGPSTNGTSTERRLRSENDQLKLALAEATVQLRIWQKGAEYADKLPFEDLEALRAAAGLPVSRFAALASVPERTYRRWLARLRDGDPVKGPGPTPRVDDIEAVAAKYAEAWPAWGIARSPR